jgi:Starch-binding associating with outer membrane
MKKIISFSILFSLLLLSSGCEKGFLDINESPNNPTDAQLLPANIMPTIQIGTGFLAGQTVQQYLTTWMQHSSGTGTQTTNYDVYSVGPLDGDTPWNAGYAVILQDIDIVKTKTQVRKDFIHLGMAQALQAYIYSVLTDLYGDIPFGSALKGSDNLFPVYEKQQDLYPKLHKLLDSAIVNLGSTNAATQPGNGDLIYGGDTDRWIRAANSLKLKLYIQARNKDTDESRAGITALINGGKLITSRFPVNQNFQFLFSANNRAQQPFYQYNHIGRPNDVAISPNLSGYMTGLADPRIPFYFTRPGNSIVTYPNGVAYNTPFPAATRSRWGVYLSGIGNSEANGSIQPAPVNPNAGASPVRFITNTMVNFWLAEAALTLGTPGDPAVYFRNAMITHFEEVNAYAKATVTATSPAIPAITDANRDTYINARLAAFNAASATGTGGKIDLLMREKWVTAVDNALESYNDLRRTGFPVIPLPQNNQLECLSDFLIRRANSITTLITYL